ncbi:MAG: hypothetical protein ACW99J_19955, partial [Candidatus Thorarchaeota archaeon]
ERVRSRLREMEEHEGSTDGSGETEEEGVIEDESDDGLKNTLADVKDVREDLHKRYAEDFLSELEKQDEYEESLETERSEEDSVVNDAADYDRDAARDDRQEGNLPYDQYDEDERNEIRKSIEDTENELEKGVDESLPESEENGKREDVERPEGESKTEGTGTWVESGDGTVTGVVTDTSESQGGSSETSEEQEENVESSESTDDTASKSEMETSCNSEHEEADGSESRTRETEADAGIEKRHERRDRQKGTDGHEDTRSDESTKESKRSLDEAGSTSEKKETSEQQEDVASDHSESPSSTESESHLDEADDDSEAGSSETTESGENKRVERESGESSGAESEAHSNSERSAEQETRERASVEQSLVEDEEATEESASDEAIEKIKEVLEEAEIEEEQIKEVLEEAEIEEERELLPNEEVIGKEYKWWETEEDRLLEKLLEGLDEETKRRLKRLLEVKIEDEEDLDRLLDVFEDELREKQGLEEAVERAREYLRFKKKQRELGISEDLDEVDLEEVAERTGVDTHDASFWVSDRERPALVRMIEELERERRMAFIWAYKNALRKFRSLTRESEHPVTYEQLERYLEKLPQKSLTETGSSRLDQCHGVSWER